MRRSIGHWSERELAVAWHTWREVSAARGAWLRSLAAATWEWCLWRQAAAWRAWRHASEAGRARSRQTRTAAARWCSHRSCFALNSWREQTRAARRRHAAVLEWRAPYRALRALFRWWRASGARGKPGLVAVRWRYSDC